MKSFVATLLLLLLVACTQAFTVQPMATKAVTSSATQLNMVFGNKKSAAQKAKEAELEEKYWQGEWVCKDCGYIYNRVSDVEG